MSLIFEKISASYHHSLPFVSFKKPKESKLKAYFGKNASLSYSTSLQDEGFLFAPFNNEKASIIFLKNAFEVTGYPTAYVNREAEWSYPEPSNVAQAVNAAQGLSLIHI